MANRAVVIGAGVTGLAAVETLRGCDDEATITLVGNERPYARMVLPYYMEGRIQEEALFTGDDAHFEDLRVDTRFGTSVRSIDAEGRRVVLTDGQELPYDSLLIATGSRAAAPPIPGADAEGILNLWTLEDARRFLAGPNSETVIIGAGFIASTILDAVMHCAKRVHLVEMEGQILPRMVDSASAELVSQHLRDRGVTIHTGTAVQSIETTGGRHQLTLAGGETITADAVILATGIHANTDCVDGTGVEVDAGIVVDGRMRSSVAGIYAGGDVAQGPILHLSERQVHAIQPTAVDHGRVAGANMAGQEVVYDGSLLMNIVATQGIEAASFGLWNATDRDTTLVLNPVNQIYRKYVWEDDQLVGGILVGASHALSAQNDVGMLKGLIQSGVALGPWKTYLEENPLDLRRVFVASGAAEKLLGSSLLAGRVSGNASFRFKRIAPRRSRSKHHSTLLTGAP